MPIYTFKCRCGHKQDMICKSSDKDVRACTKCGCGMKRMVSKTGKPLFKGSGFYETDYKQQK